MEPSLTSGLARPRGTYGIVDDLWNAICFKIIAVYELTRFQLLISNATLSITDFYSVLMTDLLTIHYAATHSMTDCLSGFDDRLPTGIRSSIPGGPKERTEQKVRRYGTPNETKISKRKRQQIVSESSFDVAVDYDFGLF